ncbi:MAG: hypothetical protein KKH44_10865, partial [Bacteroidetes bacterium]|nr:hypothetical protein [Bacteroidota bacterium]
MGEWPSRWGSFAQGFTGSIQLGSAIRAQSQQQEQDAKRLKMQEETNALRQEHDNLIMDIKKFEIAKERIEKSPDPSAIQPYIESLGVKSPFIKSSL